MTRPDPQPCAHHGPFDEPCGVVWANHKFINHAYIPTIDPRDELIARIEAVLKERYKGALLPAATAVNKIHHLIAQYKKGAADGK